MSINYKKLVKSDTFIDRYMRYMETQETPVAYDFWCACWLLSVAIGRGTIIPRPRAPVHLNLYALLIADSGVTRKSSAVRHATEIVRKYVDRLPEGELPEFIEGKITPESLEQRLHNKSHEEGHASAAISISELVTFLGRERYTMAMPGLLTDLYDCPATRIGGGTIGRGKTSIKNVYLSFLSASTPTWLAKAINPDVVEGGFTSRCMFIVSEQRKKRIAWPEDRKESNEWFVDELLRIHERAKDVKEILMTPGALKTFTRWYDNKKESRDPFSASFESREDAHVLRLAGYLAISEDLWSIDAIHIRRAIQAIAEVKRDGADIFVGGGKNDQLTQGIALLRLRLIEVGAEGIRHTKLYHRVKTYMTWEEFVTVLDVMNELGLVDQFLIDIKSRPGPKAKLWRATSLLTAPGALDNINVYLSTR